MRDSRFVEVEGSIPVVMIVVVVLGIFAATAIFMSGSSQRMEKRVEMNQTAWTAAQAAVEETLVKIRNGGVELKDARQKYAAAKAGEMFAADGIAIDPVQVMARLIEKPNNQSASGAAAEQKFQELLTAVPGFAKPDRDGTNQQWWQRYTGAPYNLKSPTGSGQTYKSGPWSQYKTKASFQDNGKVRQAFDAVQPLASLWGSAAPLTALASNPTLGHADADVAAFGQQWDTAMNAIADRVATRIAGCGGNPNYGVGAEIGAFATGAAVDADSTAEEDFRKSCQDSGELNYEANLVTVQATAHVSQAGIRVEQPVTAQRVVQKIGLSKAMDKVRVAIVPYLMEFYNLTPKDMAALGFVTNYDANWTPAVKLNPTAKMFTTLNERYSDNPSPVVWPFQIATCLSRAR